METAERNGDSRQRRERENKEDRGAQTGEWRQGRRKRRGKEGSGTKSGGMLWREDKDGKWETRKTSNGKANPNEFNELM